MILMLFPDICVDTGLRPKQCSSCRLENQMCLMLLFIGFSSEVRVVVMWLRMFPPRTFDILSEILETLEVWESWPAVLEMCVLLYQLWPLLEFLEYYQPKALTCVLCLLVFPTQIADIPEMRVVGAEHMLIQSARWPCSSENAYWSMLLV